MKVHLALNHLGVNHLYHKGLWEKAVSVLGWKQCPVDESDVTVMWGPNPEYERTRARARPVLMVDFPYWNRGWKNRDGTEFYKVSLNGQHPTPYVMLEEHTPERYLATNGPAIMPWKKDGDYILLAGVGIKAAVQNGYSFGEWEAKIAKVIRDHTDMPIIYRPKPRQVADFRIEGTQYDDGSKPIEEAIKGAYAVVCHHGNPTVAALAAGVPIFMNGMIGAASHYACHDFTKIKTPMRPGNRERFFYNLAHWQWSVEEITSGKAFLSYKERGLI